MHGRDFMIWLKARVAGKIVLAISAAFFVSLSTAFAFPVTIDPGAYTGTYRVANSGNFTGEIIFDLVEGRHFVRFAATGNGFFVNVDASGVVTSENLAAASGTGSTLTFNTSDVTINAGAYPGNFFVSAASEPRVSGTRTFPVVTGVSGWVINFAATGNSFRFDVDNAGTISSQNVAAAETNGSQLFFITAEFQVDPTDFDGTYRILGIADTPTTGARLVVAPKGVSGYVLSIRPGVSERFSVDADGNPNPSILPINVDGIVFNFLLSAFTLAAVDIDIKPSGGGNDVEPNEEPNPWNPNSRGKVPVAVLTSDIFDAADVNVSSVRFGKIGTEAEPVRDSMEDVDGDGDLDLLLKFEVQEAGIECFDPLATLTGETIFGSGFEGTDPIRTVGCNNNR